MCPRLVKERRRAQRWPNLGKGSLPSLLFGADCGLCGGSEERSALAWSSHERRDSQREELPGQVTDRFVELPRQPE